MKKYMILFVLGQDRPGIVDDVSSFLFDRQANIEDSRMAVLGGCFSIMILFSCNEEQLWTIKSNLPLLEKLGFELSLHEAGDPAQKTTQAELPLKIEATALDHPGIVQNLVRILRRHAVNILSLNTRVVRAPLSGAPLFDLVLEAAVPAETPINRVKEELNTLAEEMNLDLIFKK